MRAACLMGMHISVAGPQDAEHTIEQYALFIYLFILMKLMK